MSLPRLRFTVRAMMVAVAIVAAVLGLKRRMHDFSRRAEYHLLRADELAKGCVFGKMFRDDPDRSRASQHEAERQNFRVVAFHANLGVKYARAARYPWLSVAPDPPEPK